MERSGSLPLYILDNEHATIACSYLCAPETQRHCASSAVAYLLSK